MGCSINERLEPLHMNLSERVVVDTNSTDWLGSRAEGVRRKPLERERAESGRTTSLVEFLSNAGFPEHSHPLGEEILVLEGVFSDERGDYPAGTYFRNPPGSAHSPSSAQGCVLFVKLDQFADSDRETVVINTHDSALWQLGHSGLKVMTLHRFATENTALVFWPAGTQFNRHSHFGGEEIFVLSGELIDEHGRYPQGTWLRNPHLSEHSPYVEEDTLIWVKTGHL